MNTRLMIATLLLATAITSIARAQWIPFGSQTTITPPDIANALLKDHEEYVKKRMRFQSDLLTSIFETTQNVTVNKGHKDDEYFKDVRQYLRTDVSVDTISNPSLTLNQRVNIGTVNGLPLLPGEIPTCRVSMFVRLYRELTAPAPQSPGLQQAAPELLWQSDTIYGDVSGLGTFDISTSFIDPNFTAFINPGEILNMETTIISSFDASNVASDDLEYLITTDDFSPGLGETTFSLDGVTVPEPSLVGLMCVAPLFLRRRKSIQFT